MSFEAATHGRVRRDDGHGDSGVDDVDRGGRPDPAGRTARTARPVAAIEGTVLSVVNQAEVIIGGHATAGTWDTLDAPYDVLAVTQPARECTGLEALRRDRPARPRLLLTDDQLHEHPAV